MEDRLENKISMYGKVVEFATEYELVMTQPVFPSLKAKLDAKYESILEEMEQSGTNNTGYAEQKEIVRKQLFEIGFKVASGVALYYTLVVADRIEVRKVKYTATEWQQMRDTVFYTTARRVYKKAATIAASLVNYEVTGDDLNSMNTLLDSYFDLLNEPKFKISEQGGSLEKLVEKAVDMDDFLENEMDVLMDTIKFTNTELYATYRGCRTIDDTGSGNNQPDEEFEQTLTPGAYFSTGDTASLTDDSSIEITNNSSNTDIVVGFSNGGGSTGPLPQTISGGETKAFKVTQAGFAPGQTVFNIYNTGGPGGETVTVDVKLFFD